LAAADLMESLLLYGPERAVAAHPLSLTIRQLLSLQLQAAAAAAAEMEPVMIMEALAVA
jgi:hypothetical protein